MEWEIGPNRSAASARARCHAGAYLRNNLETVRRQTLDLAKAVATHTDN
jgi:hypothetical protein